MADNMDRLLFDIGREQDQQVDYDAIFEAILAKAEAPKAPQATAGQRIKRWRVLGAAAAFVAVLGIGSLFVGAPKAPAAEAPAAETSAEEAPAAAPAMARGGDGAAYQGEMKPEAEYSGSSVMDMPAEEAQPAPMAEEAEAQMVLTSENSFDAAEQPALIETVELGVMQEGFEERLDRAGLELSQAEPAGDIEPGFAALVQDSQAGSYVIWNAGENYYRIDGAALDLEEIAGLLE